MTELENNGSDGSIEPKKRGRKGRTENLNKLPLSEYAREHASMISETLKLSDSDTERISTSLLNFYLQRKIKTSAGRQTVLVICFAIIKKIAPFVTDYFNKKRKKLKNNDREKLKNNDNETAIQ